MGVEPRERTEIARPHLERVKGCLAQRPERGIRLVQGVAHIGGIVVFTAREVGIFARIGIAVEVLHRLLQHCWIETDLRRERRDRSEEHTSELQSLMRISYAVFCLKKKT